MRADLQAIFAAGLARVDPYRMMINHLRLVDDRLVVDFDGQREEFPLAGRRVLVLGAGKASAPMARAVEDILGDRVGGGLVAVKYGHGDRLQRIDLVEAGHPTPDDNGQLAARRIAELAAAADAGTLVITLISGGASALAPAPMAGLTLADKQAVTRGLLACGADIGEINCVRKHLSALKGGRLLGLLEPAQNLSFILSDVVGDRLDTIGSGLTCADRSSYADALAIVLHYGLDRQLPAAVMEVLRQGARGDIADTPKPGDPVTDRARNFVIGSNRAAVLAAGERAQALGYRTVLLTSSLTGEAREIAKALFAIARDIRDHGLLAERPACVIAGGETVVTLKGPGKGGRNQEMALAFLAELANDAAADDHAIAFLAASTDGSDGPTDAAGAFADTQALRRAGTAGLSLRGALAANDSYHFFDAIDGLLKTGATRTNVCDLQVMLVR